MSVNWTGKLTVFVIPRIARLPVHHCRVSWECCWSSSRMRANSGSGWLDQYGFVRWREEGAVSRRATTICWQPSSSSGSCCWQLQLFFLAFCFLYCSAMGRQTRPWPCLWPIKSNSHNSFQAVVASDLAVTSRFLDKLLWKPVCNQESQLSNFTRAKVFIVSK